MHVAAVLTPRRHICFRGVKDDLPVIVHISHWRPPGLVAPSQVRIHPQPVEVGLRPYVQAHVVPLRGECAWKLCADPREPIRLGGVTHIVARVLHARPLRLGAYAGATARLRERVGDNVGRVVVAVVLRLLRHEAPAVVRLRREAHLRRVVWADDGDGGACERTRASARVSGHIAHARVGGVATFTAARAGAGVAPGDATNISWRLLVLRTRGRLFVRMSATSSLQLYLRLNVLTHGPSERVERRLSKKHCVDAIDSMPHGSVSKLPAGEAHHSAWWRRLGRAPDDSAEGMCVGVIEMDQRVRCAREHQQLDDSAGGAVQTLKHG
mmetsp:Transcript_8033/g.19259  ORF Transcript_8033/g.19259 Transcript_8033/m.19259 type:complete len:325 (+) Transcript_8033:298-1272(+)